MIRIQSSFTVGSIILIFLRTLSTTALNLKDAPCDFKDTVPLEPSSKLDNGSYLYDNILVPADAIGIYNYEILVGNIKTPAEPHIRGCICKFHNCISICCRDEAEFHNGTCRETDFEPESNINITTDKGIVSVNLFQQFAVQYYKPCSGLYYLHPDQNGDSNFSIMENGSLYKIEEKRIYKKDSYCLSPMIDSSITKFTYTPLQCYLPNPVNVADIQMNGYALLISVPFMILTIIIYLILPDLRTIHGLSFCCYLGGLSVGYLTLAYLIFETDKISPLVCSISGYTIYFGFMSAFFWLSVISFDLYTNIHGSETKKMKIFRLYCLYAWGLAFISLISSHGWSAFIYFYGPILVIVSFNTVMFVLTFIQIRKRTQLAAFNGVHKPHNDHRALFMTFLRLFVIMGITWLAEIFAYATPRSSWLSKIFKITDFLNGIQGVVIFFLFVVFRKSVRKQLRKKYGKTDEEPCTLDQPHPHEKDLCLK